MIFLYLLFKIDGLLGSSASFMMVFPIALETMGETLIVLKILGIK